MPDKIFIIYGISQNPYTKDYIMVLQDICYKMYNTNGNEKIDKLVQEMQLKINSRYDIIFEWIPYNQFDNIKEIGKGDVATVYSAIWKDGPLNYGGFNGKYTRKSDKKV